MPGYLLTQGDTVMCQHGGSAQAATASPKVKAGGQPVIVQSATYTVSGCPFTVGSSPSPCVTAQWTSAASQVKVSGVPVLLADSQATCTPNGTGVNITMTQTRVKGK